MYDRPSPDWAEYSIYDNLDLADQSCLHLPEMCGGAIPGWKYDGYCECGEFLLWEESLSYPRYRRGPMLQGHDTPNRCTKDN